MVVKGEGAVQDDAKVACREGGTNSGVVNGQGEVASFGEGGFGAYEEEFRFITVELEDVLLHPCFYCRAAGFNAHQRGVEEGFGAEGDLGVIGGSQG